MGQMNSLEECFSLKDKRALVTGAASGLGLAIAGAFAAQGAVILAADRNRTGLRDAASAFGAACECHVFDQADIATIEALCAAAGDVDILVNNAGIALREPILELRWRDLRQLVDVNLVGPIAFTRLIGEKMTQRKGGTIINVSSQMAFTGGRGRAVYAATKAAISQFTKSTALELAPWGIRVNCIAPGRIVTPLNRPILEDPAEYEAGLRAIPLGRYGRPEEIAWAALFLASHAADYITGHTLIVDGGWVAE